MGRLRIPALTRNLPKMNEQNAATRQLRNIASHIGTVYGEWMIFLFIQGMIETSTEGGGILDKVKSKYQIADYITTLLKEYFTRLKPFGGSFAGSKIASPARPTRASTSSPPDESEGMVDNPQGDSDLTEVIKDIIKKEGLDDKAKLELTEAGRMFKLILEKALDDPHVGLRKNADKFVSFHITGLTDAYKVLDEIMGELQPLEVLIQGPEITLSLEYTHSTRSNVSLRIDEIMQWREILNKSFRSSTPTTVMSDSLISERRPYLMQLSYLVSPNLERRLKLKSPNDNTHHAVRTEVQPLITKVITSPELTAPQIAALVRPTLKMHSSANLKTETWGPKQTHKLRNPQAHITRSGGGRGNSEDSEYHHYTRHANAARFAAGSNADDDKGRTSQHDRSSSNYRGRKPPWGKPKDDKDRRGKYNHHQYPKKPWHHDRERNQTSRNASTHQGEAAPLRNDKSDSRKTPTWSDL